MKRTEVHETESKLKFSHHARIRQAQRNIGDSVIDKVRQNGYRADHEESKIITDQNVKIVLSKDNTVITVIKNTRNTRFQLSERTKQKEQSLMYKVNVRKDSSAMCELAALYTSGELGEKNMKKAFILYEKAANMGNSHAMCHLSQLYESDHLGKPNLKLADKWMKMAADKNNVFALGVTGQKLLAKYVEKYPVNSNIFRPSAPKNEILQYLNKAAAKGSTRGMWQIGNIYENGLLGEKDLSKAKECYVKAAKLGSPASLNSLHNMASSSIFSARELEEILDEISSFLHVTSQGMAFDLGKEQLIGVLGTNPVRGLKMIEQVAIKQLDQAISLLAKCYLQGISCDSNLKLGHYWNIKLKELYDVSAKSGNIRSLSKLAKLYLNGSAGKIDLERAEFCIKEVIQQSSDPKELFSLGMLYLHGSLGNKPIQSGVELVAEAIKIWQGQVASGDSSAYNYLGTAYYDLNNIKMAMHWLCKAPSDNIEAQLLLAKIYLDNCPEKNKSLGLKILENVILEHGTPPSEAFEDANSYFTPLVISWLQDIAIRATETISKENSNLRIFENFVLTKLAILYGNHKLIGIDYDLASKYYYHLFLNFKCVESGNKLIHMYLDKHLPSEYFDTVKNWALEISALVKSDEINIDDFMNYVWLLGKLHKIGDILPYNVQEASKWLYLLLYYYRDNMVKLSDIENEISELPQLECNQKSQVVSDLTDITKSLKINSPVRYRLMTRILGDIFNDGKLVNRNIDESIHWYTESANINNSIAAFELGKIYKNDKQDIDTSIEWYMLSTQLGNKIAIKVLKEMVDEHRHDSLQSFLNKYQHIPQVQESELQHVTSYKNLEFYPNTTKEKVKLGKSLLGLGGEQNVLNAAYWFRLAINYDSIEAAMELYSMYKSGILGNQLVECAENMYLDIINMCRSKIRLSIHWNKDQSYILSLLNIVASVLKLSEIPNASLSNKKIKKLISGTNLINSESLTDLIFDLEMISEQVFAHNTISSALDICLLAKDISRDGCITLK